ncbi:4-amino-4-deoxy-L-arabinose transferase [Nocardioides mangrovi]|uniref:4-amino-4-deoxy-L-arabinose transferase n=1 Tax=Nocardioides mangrovi TaxID=2874580 RepID=A0ABS7UK15_9ACTN|nr:4-amino-4-deoxy-L-arabinose transferase [Nocardioides mangrovi]MBZ5741125.1 4-amino-4-deoxy-L-arabinose transferase [Nocardioides mangrovi]
MASPSDAADAADAAGVVDLLLSRPSTLGSARLLCIDGPSGSGKTELAAAVSALVETPVVHMDDLYEGWDGLAAVDGQLESLLRPLSRGLPGGYRRYDWHARAFAETVTVSPAPVVVVEGVGSGARTVADLVTVLVWVDADRDVRRRRGLERDGATFAPYWDAWEVAERERFARDRTSVRADLALWTS